MSGAVAMVRELCDLVPKVNTGTLAAGIELAGRIGAGAQVKGAVDALVSAIRELHRLLAALRSRLESAAVDEQVDAVAALIGLCSDLLDALGKLASPDLLGSFGLSLGPLGELHGTLDTKGLDGLVRDVQEILPLLRELVGSGKDPEGKGGSLGRLLAAFDGLRVP